MYKFLLAYMFDGETTTKWVFRERANDLMIHLYSMISIERHM